MHAIKINPSNSALRQNLGIARTLSGDCDGAIAALNHSLELDTDSCDTHFNLGTALVEINQRQAVREHLLRFAACAGSDRAPQVREARRLLEAIDD